jgi:pyrimidine operon attenuation protein / uracil phosphoribosyltransferase
MSRSDLNRSRSGQQILEGIGGGLDAAQADYGYADGARKVINQLEGQGPDRGTGQTAAQSAQTGQACPSVQAHCGVGVGRGEGIGTRLLDRFGYRQRLGVGGQLNPEGTTRNCARGGDDFLGQARVAAKLRAAMVDVWAGNVQLIGGKALGSFQDADYLAIFGHRAAKNVSDDRRLVLAKQRKLLGHEGAYANVLQTHGVEQSSRSLAKARSRRAFHGFHGKAFDDDSAESVQIHQMGELDSVAKGTASGNDGVRKKECTDTDAEVNVRGPPGACGRAHKRSLSRGVGAGGKIVSSLLHGYRCVTIVRLMRIIEKRQLMSADEIRRTLERLAHEIVEKTGGAKDLALIGVRRRGIPLAERLAQSIRASSKAEVPVGTLDITLYRDDLSTVAPQPVVQSSEISFAVDERDLLLVDDVLYTGRTVRAAMNGLFDLGRPRRIRLCVLVDRGHRELPIEATFVGRTVETTDTEIIEVRLKEIDHDERVVVMDRVD